MNEQRNSPQAPPPNYLAFAILATIFCGKIFGIVALIFAAQVNTKWNAGDFTGALNASKNAKLWSWISVGVGIAWIGIITFLSVIGVIIGLSFGDF